MSIVDLSDWTPEQQHTFEQYFRALKESAGDQPLALTPVQRDIAVQLGLIPPLSVMVEVLVHGKLYRGLLSLQDDDEIYRGIVYE